MKSFSVSLIYASVIFGFSSAATSASSCYYPDGSLAPTSDKPCNTTSDGHSGCCTAPCMDSGLCFDSGLVSRGSCTDSTWSDPSCPQYCLDFNPSGGAPMIPQTPSTDGLTSELGWCCGFPLTNGSCPDGGAEIRVAAGTVVAQVASSTSTTSGTPTSTSTSTSTSTTSPSSASSNSTASEEKKCAANNDVAIGTSIGISLGLAVAGLLFLWLRERKLRKSEGAAGLAGEKNMTGNYQDSHVVPSDPKHDSTNGYTTAVPPPSHLYQQPLGTQRVELQSERRIGELA